ncbi:MAG: hypothetical protein A2Z59_04385 [Nitrospinae bacterium RIFCSPLOWO2_02_39_17]|nr:MAG: hypothetical protein A2Z59_04385 [Nitrospinae bacterium RIFCSPLOWO2_02_39_17]
MDIIRVIINLLLQTIRAIYYLLLFDPYSAVYRFGLPIKGYAYVNGTLQPPVFGYIVIVGINAKNRMGGYVGEEDEIYLKTISFGGIFSIHGGEFKINQTKTHLLKSLQKKHP